MKLFVASLSILAALPAVGSPAIRVDQVGYPAAAKKLAVVAAPAAERFTLHRFPDGEKVLDRPLSKRAKDRDSGELVRIADFSEIDAPGRYEIRVEGAGRSDPFAIEPDPYRDLLRLAARSYYGQRCGTAVDLGDGRSYSACHLDAAFHPSSGREGESEHRGGWHDAGDYGRYVVNSGIATATLLWTFELFPEVVSELELDIPESGDGTPDLLDEVRWNLEWMLSMQDEDGGVWHKQTSEAFPPFVMPDEDRSTSLVIGTGRAPFKSSCATGNLAAVAAIAARTYRPWDESFAERALAASRRAWSWLAAHPRVRFRNPAGVGTGEYGDPDCSDERLWAAAELWRTTGDADVHAWLRDRARDLIRAAGEGPPDWRTAGAMAAWTLALGGGADPPLGAAIRRRAVDAADAIAARSRRSPYRIPMTRGDWVWGSNGVAANYALQLLVANAMQRDPEYTGAALEILHYLLGRNPFSLSFVTGTGTRSVLHPHHRPSGSDDVAEPWPGLLAGGPNRNRQDPVLKALPRGTSPAKMYADDQESFAGNEVAINWNAPLVFALAGLAAAE
ncbi:MAG TPA: glycoside hydrolase family 9 protein [Thermoanaerobaculia bacterium]|nr:glycoside hydrolase family 9 protein [Thermoanaerobaculia bacterium]